MSHDLSTYSLEQLLQLLDTCRTWIEKARMPSCRGVPSSEVYELVEAYEELRRAYTLKAAELGRGFRLMEQELVTTSKKKVTPTMKRVVKALPKHRKVEVSSIEGPLPPPQAPL